MSGRPTQSAGAGVNSARKKIKGDATATKKIFGIGAASFLTLVLYVVAGVATGLSAPGFNQWYFAWIGLIPLLLGIAASRSVWSAFVYATLYGLSYNLVYLNWYLHLAPLNWLGLADWESVVVATLAWLFVALHQALIIGIFAAICKLIPLTGNYYPTSIEGRWHLPAAFVIPLAWAVVEKFANMSDWLGVPWSMLEYSQYRQLPIIQGCSLFGGTGLAFLIVLTNTALACVIATAVKKYSCFSLAGTSVSTVVGQLLAVALVVSVLYGWGLNQVDAQSTKPRVDLSIVQGNINIDMQKTVHKYTLSELMARYLKIVSPAPLASTASLASTATLAPTARTVSASSPAHLTPPGICIFTESALPTYLRNEAPLQKSLEDLARSIHMDLVLGSMDCDTAGHSYNSAYGIASNGTLLSTVYHKRYLVPFGEYTPQFVKSLPDMRGLPAWMRMLTSTPAGSGFTAGKGPVILALNAGRIAPTICSEAVSPQTVATSVRAGGQLIINISDLAWFHRSMIGDQMIAFSVIRAVENDRYFVLAANSGPSAIVDPVGHITARSAQGTVELVRGRIDFKSGLTPYTQLGL